MTDGSPALSHRIQSKRPTGGRAIRFQSKPSVLLGAVLLGVVLAAGSFAQNDSGNDVRFRLRTSVDLVLVPVTAKDEQGNLVTDLRREEFRLFENGEEQPIRYFSIDPFPLSAVILVDAGLNRSGHQVVHTTLPVLPSVFGPSDEFALFAFDTHPRQVLDFTREADELRLALGGLGEDSSVVPSGGTGGPMTAGPRINNLPVGPGVISTLPQAGKSVKTIHDALFAAGMALRDREPGRRRVVFIISDGLNSRLNTHTFEETRDLLLEGEISVYALGVGNARFSLGRTVLSQYAHATGGDAYAPMKKKALPRAYARIAEQARHQYTLVYTARPAAGGREYRRIHVRVQRPGVTLLAREGYFAGVPTH